MRQQVRDSDILARGYGIVIWPGNPWRLPAFDWDQLLAAVEGSFEVRIEGARWKISAGQGLWLPAGHRHEIVTLTRADICAFYSCGSTLRDSRLIRVSVLLRELMARVAKRGSLYAGDPVDRAVAELAMDEIARAPAIPLEIKWPSGRETRGAAEMLAKPSPTGSSIEDAAEKVGMSKRSLERRFRAELNMGVAEWLREWRLVEAVRLLLAGEAVAEIGYRVGFSTASAFAESFKTKYGLSPRHFRDTYADTVR